MKIQAINFKTPIIKSNVSFGYGSNAGKSGVDSNSSGYRHISDISRAESDSFVCKSSKIDPKKEFKGRQIQADSLNVLSWANTKQKEAKRKYAEAKKIHRDWQKEKLRMLVDKNGTTKEFFTHAGKLEQYIETKPDGSKLIIGYFPEGPYSITQIGKNGKENIYLFYQNGKLAEYTEGKSEKTTSHNHITTREEVYKYSNGYLSSCAENQQTIHTFGDSLKARTEVVADLEMFFELAGKRPYLKKAETQTGTSNGTVIAPEDTFLYDKHGKLIEAR